MNRHRGGIDVMDHEPPTRPYTDVHDNEAQRARRAVATAALRGGWTTEIPDVLDALGLNQAERTNP